MAELEAHSTPLDGIDSTTPAAASTEPVEPTAPTRAKKRKKKKRSRPAANSVAPVSPPAEPLWQRVVLGVLATLMIAAGAWMLKVWLLDRPQSRYYTDLATEYMSLADAFRYSAMASQAEFAMIQGEAEVADVQREALTEIKRQMVAANRQFQIAAGHAEQILAAIPPDVPLHAEITLDFTKLQSDYAGFIALANRVDRLATQLSTTPQPATADSPADAPDDD